MTGGSTRSTIIVEIASMDFGLTFNCGIFVNTTDIHHRQPLTAFETQDHQSFAGSSHQKCHTANTKLT